MNKYLLAVLGFGFLTFGAKAQKFNLDSLIKEAAKTEVYSPVPPKVTAGKTPQDAPSDAIILFNGTSLDAWTSDEGKPAGWKLEDGVMSINNLSGGITTKQKFTDYQLHLEWREPKDVVGSGQSRGNSGVYLAFLGLKNKFLEMGYEIQILDNYENKTYVNGQAASIYKQYIPLANACKPAGEWQTYDIIWKAPRFGEDSSLKKPAYVTVIHNGVLVQDHVEVQGQTFWVGKPYYAAHGPAPIRLQAHGDPGPTVSFRNIWIRPL